MTDPRKALKDQLADWRAWGVDAVPKAGEGARPAPKVEAPPVPASPAVAANSTTVAAAGAASLDDLRAIVAECTRCTLCKTRIQTVFCSGKPSPIMFVGEAPGADEDEKGEAFVGAAGKMLTKLLAQVGISRDQIYIANVLKCRPPNNRPPEPSEAAACAPFLQRQIALVNPKILCALGKHAAASLMSHEGPMKGVRGTWRLMDGRWVTATYHPSYLLRSPSETPSVLEDLRGLLSKLQSLGGKL